ncbi:carotenoid oxygenase family protein [Phormidium sp. FACHB-592]|uniref:Carotenoid oxygenase family protein n=1 Tax=Stenomitos frigidus AS-A4 TaxID=2933935 RepID=A0ABV0KJS7_9CYAN|nr:carotenoid oxygenase family protein [Phormidium sp. FACHB-592]MBD2073521.1 carotenoid oxygenase family protein [Phormidium sp. FACHB-592]
MVTTHNEPCLTFHHVNAFERDGETVVNLVAYPNAMENGTVQIWHSPDYYFGEPVFVAAPILQLSTKKGSLY